MDSSGPWPRQVVFMRHGLSVFNRDDMFTGWCDVPLAHEGEKECVEAGRLLAATGYNFDVAHCSVLRRACISLYRVLEGSRQQYVPIKTSWRLNERHYGALQGKSKQKVEEELGQIVREWRRSFSVRPPPMQPDHPHWPLIANDPRYRGIDLPVGESLEDTAARAWSYWENEICADVAAGKTVLVVAHANTIRSLVKVLDDLSESDIKNVHIPTGDPFIYRLDRDFRPVGKPDSHGFRGLFLADLLAERKESCVAADTKRWSICQELMMQDPENVPDECLFGGLEGCVVAEDPLMGEQRQQQQQQPQPKASAVPRSKTAPELPPVFCPWDPVVDEAMTLEKERQAIKLR